ncbi:unnamed protein product [Caenorhabditis brenneri]
MLDVLNLPLMALQVVFAIYTFQQKINLTLTCSRAKRVMRVITSPNAVINLEVVVKYDGDYHYVEIDVGNEQKESMGRWIFEKRAMDFTSSEIIGETYVSFDPARHPPTDRLTPLTGVQSFHVMKSVVSFLDHMEYIFPNMTVDIVLENINSSKMEGRLSFNKLFSRTQTIEFKRCTIPKEEMASIHELFQQHHILVIRSSQLKFSEKISVQKIKFCYEYLKWASFFDADMFPFFQCQEIVIHGEFSTEKVVKMLRSWGYGKHPQLKKMKLSYVREPSMVLSSLRAKEWSEPGPRTFKLDNFELDCTKGWDIRGPNNVVGTLNFRENQLTFVVWN